VSVSNKENLRRGIAILLVSGGIVFVSQFFGTLLIESDSEFVNSLASVPLTSAYDNAAGVRVSAEPMNNDSANYSNTSIPQSYNSSTDNGAEVSVSTNPGSVGINDVSNADSADDRMKAQDMGDIVELNPVTHPWATGIAAQVTQSFIDREIGWVMTQAPADKLSGWGMDIVRHSYDQQGMSNANPMTVKPTVPNPDLLGNLWGGINISMDAFYEQASAVALKLAQESLLKMNEEMQQGDKEIIRDEVTGEVISETTHTSFVIDPLEYIRRQIKYGLWDKIFKLADTNGDGEIFGEDEELLASILYNTADSVIYEGRLPSYEVIVDIEAELDLEEPLAAVGGPGVFLQTNPFSVYLHQKQYLEEQGGKYGEIARNDVREGIKPKRRTEDVRTPDGKIASVDIGKIETPVDAIRAQLTSSFQAFWEGIGQSATDFSDEHNIIYLLIGCFLEDDAGTCLARTAESWITNYVYDWLFEEGFIDLEKLDEENARTGGGGTPPPATDGPIGITP